MTPRTVSEFAASGLRVSLSCGSCNRVQALSPDVLDATFGPDFDLVAGHRQISSQLYCPHCGAGRPGVRLEAVKGESTVMGGRAEPQSALA